ncbi:MAG TPA: HEAT repeat domain-containing protein [Kofleriaceae bacterium]|nr:HEAT repeat domain-containing protein [Kofleriaceae bacterium]
MAVATYPGTVSPLRGLDPFGEAERDVWQGRETERDELARMVTADGFRAGLLFGEPGVGKTSLVRAGLIPHLRDHGIVALACEDFAQPGASFATGLSAFGIQPNPQEPPTAFITRAVSNAVAGQQFVFVIDDIDLACGDDRQTSEIAELFAKVVSRSAGRARFLFVAASDRMHALGALERRTGSLFPPSTRFELPRIPKPAATAILDRVLSLSGIAADPPLADALVQGLAKPSGLLAADLQIAAMAMRDLHVSSIPALQRMGGPSELESAWLHDACRATGNERSALRLCAELAVGTHGPRQADHVIRRVNLDTQYAQHAFGVLEQRGVIVRGDATGSSWMLRHEVLQTRVRELTAPARAAARRAFDLLGSKTANHGRLSLRELRALRTEGIAPVTPAEIDVVQRSRRHYMMIAGGIAAVPIILLIVILVSMRGRVFFDLGARPGGDRVIVRGGRAGLSAFGWLPGGGYGKQVADTGLTRAMVAPEVWKKIEGRDLGAPRGSWSDELPGMMAPQLAGLVDYATTGNEATLAALQKAAKDPEDLAELLIELRPIARGKPAEVQLIEAALATPSPAVQRAAVAAAGAAAQRRDVYTDTLEQALISSDAELRHIAFSAVRSLGERGRALFQSALQRVTNPDARRELQVEVSVASTDETPSAAAAISVLADPSSSDPQNARAKGQIEAALAQDPTGTATALTGLFASDTAPLPSRKWAIEMLRDLDPMPKVPNLVESARAAFGSHSAAIRAAALPLYAKVDPERAAKDLAPMLDDKKLDKSLRAASALAWGEVAAIDRGAAEGALDKLIKDDDGEVRAAAATAAGKLGRSYQDRLVKMAKTENYNVRIGAAEGLAGTALSGGNVGVAIDGIAQLWREKGRPRRDAVTIWAHLARKKPFDAVVQYLASAARITEDPALHPIAVQGLCNASLGSGAAVADARRALAKSTDDPSADVRRLVMQCVADGPDPAKNGAAIAAHLVKDLDNGIRADAARVLALTVGKGKVAPGIGDALVALLDDPDREVRLIAIRAVGALGSDVPKTAGPALLKLFERGDEGEKLALLRTAQQVGADELVERGVTDHSSGVRIAAVDAALGSGLRAAATLSAALADTDPQVRKAALERLASQKDKIDPQVRDRALALAVHDPDPELAQTALTTIARVAPKDAVVARLHRSLGSRLERERAEAAAAAIGLVDREPAAAVQLLEPLLDDPSHDVRVAMLPALAMAYAKLNTPEKLAGLLADSEGDAMRRLVVAAAFVMLARTDAGAAASDTQLKKVSADGPPMARATAKLVAGLIAGKTDGIAFVQELVP